MGMASIHRNSNEEKKQVRYQYNCEHDIFVSPHKIYHRQKQESGWHHEKDEEIAVLDVLDCLLLRMVIHGSQAPYDCHIYSLIATSILL